MFDTRTVRLTPDPYGCEPFQNKDDVPSLVEYMRCRTLLGLRPKSISVLTTY